MKIQKQTFEDDTVELDGNQFHDCHFVRCTMIYCGRTPAVIQRCGFENCEWHFNEAAGRTLDFLRSVVTAGGDVGRLMVSNTFPEIKDWLQPEIREKIESGQIDDLVSEGDNG